MSIVPNQAGIGAEAVASGPPTEEGPEIRIEIQRSRGKYSAERKNQDNDFQKPRLEKELQLEGATKSCGRLRLLKSFKTALFQIL